MTTFVLIGDLHYGYSDKNMQLVKDMIRNLPESDVLLMSGDIISHKQSQWQPILEYIAQEHPNSLKLAVLGNHDYWGMTHYTTDMTHVLDLFDALKIQYLQNITQPVLMNGIAIFGFDGWYNSRHPPSNDADYMGEFFASWKGDVWFHDFLFQKALEQKAVIEGKMSRYKKSVILTHFEPNLHAMGAPFDWIDDFRRHEQKQLVFCCGHTHQRREEYYGKFSFFNSGSDYESPNFIKFTL